MPVCSGNIGIAGGGSHSGINGCTGGCIAPQAVIPEGGRSAVGVGHAGRMILIGCICGRSLQIDACFAALLQSCTGAVACTVISSRDADIVVGGFGHVVGAIIIIGIGAVATRSLLDQVCSIVLEILIAVTGGGSSF